MEREVFGKEVADAICRLTGWPEALDIRDDGVYVKDDYLSHDPSEQAFTWTPACEMDWPGAPDPLSAPALPIPFASRNLAAFILDAAGYGIQSRFGRIEHGLDEGELESLSMRATKVRQTLREAYKLAQAAQCVVGADNIEEQQRAADLLSAYGNARDEAMEREKVPEKTPLTHAVVMFACIGKLWTAMHDYKPDVDVETIDRALGLSTINQEHTAILAALTIKKPSLNTQLTLL